jgi:hypothetical protein
VGILAKTEKICAQVAEVLLAGEKKKSTIKEILYHLSKIKFSSEPFSQTQLSHSSSC